MHGQAVLTRGGLLRRGAVGGGALLASASGLAAVAPTAFADGAPASDLAYLRLLIAAELLAVDFYGQTVWRSTFPFSDVTQRIAFDEWQHYKLLAGLMTAAGQTPATSGDFDFAYPAGTFVTPRSALRFGKELERMLTFSHGRRAVPVIVENGKVTIGFGGT